MWRTKRLGARRLMAVACLLLAAAVHADAPPDQRLYDARGGRLELYIDPQLDPASRRDMVRWIEAISDSLAGVFGHWPRALWRVYIQSASGPSSDPIPWAQVDRGEVDTVRFYVVTTTPAEQLIREWTGYHELAHLLIPYRGWGDTWFSEGLATYYQNLLQARSGVIDERQLWQNLYEGFQRGRSDRHEGQSLRSVSARMRQHGGFMRVYWSGAWYFLAADLALRSRADGSHSLDAALRRLNTCCADQRLSVAEIISALDRDLPEPVFAPLYAEVVDTTDVPDFEYLFERLGLRIDGGVVSLAGTPAQAALRTAIARAGAFNR